MNTIRVMARPERAYPTAHARKATPWQALRYQTASCAVPPTASVQFRRALPAPSHRTAVAATCTIYNRVMARPGTRQRHRTCKKATHCKSLPYQAASRGASPTASIQFRRALPAPSHTMALMTTFSISFLHLCTLPSSFRWRGRHGPQITCAKAHLSSGTTRVQSELNEGVDVKHALRPS
jgi:hypothetical protein